MTKTEARAHLGLKETDPIQQTGLRTLLEIAETALRTGHYAPSEKANLEKEAAAYRALLDD